MTPMVPVKSAVGTRVPPPALSTSVRGRLRFGRSAMSSHGLKARAIAVLRQRCPRCLEGRVFRGMLAMNDACPECGLVFEREPGYFVGAMYVSYAMAIPA